MTNTSNYKKKYLVKIESSFLSYIYCFFVTIHANIVVSKSHIFSYLFFSFNLNIYGWKLSGWKMFTFYVTFCQFDGEEVKISHDRVKNTLFTSTQRRSWLYLTQKVTKNRLIIFTHIVLNLSKYWRLKNERLLIIHCPVWKIHGLCWLCCLSFEVKQPNIWKGLCQ